MSVQDPGHHFSCFLEARELFGRSGFDECHKNVNPAPYLSHFGVPGGARVSFYSMFTVKVGCLGALGLTKVSKM